MHVPHACTTCIHTRCKEIFKKMRQRGAEGGNSLYGLVSAIHLANAEIGREATISLQELLMSQACAYAYMHIHIHTASPCKSCS